jgi:phosphoribosylformylglycinamidine synthase, clade II
MNMRIFIEKKAAFNIEAVTLLHELQHSLQTTSLTSVRKIQIYEVFDIDENLLEKAVKTIFTEQVTDMVLTEADFMSTLEKYPNFCIESLPGQFDQRADSAQAALLLLGGSQKTTVHSAQGYIFNHSLLAAELAAIKKYMLNPVDSRFKKIENPLIKPAQATAIANVPILTAFNTATIADFTNLKSEKGLAMEVADLLHIQTYFKEVEKRNPTETELRVLDTYWSDHCRHTTFETELTQISFQKSQFSKQLQQSYEKYLTLRNKTNRTEKPQTLMDMATIFSRFQRATGTLDDLEVSDEINACSIRITVDVDGKNEPWLLMFKNETHNHPTEIEPFGGASTCIGGAIRDPLSGRSYVYQAMRITGAGNILEPVSETLAGKLPQQTISKGAAKGYSSYGNQIGLATTYVKEYFHPGFVAKRMEVGAVVGAVPEELVVRAKPQPDDVVILLGGKTGRDGIGGATGSSKVQTAETVETSGSEVQKGNAIEERKIQRLFRNPKVTKMIKKSNDFGAGGVSVAIGELADGIVVDLNKVPLKYQGLNGTELAISESQERMAVVVAKNDVQRFIDEAALENLEAVAVAKVTTEPRLVLMWHGEKIVDIARSFLDTNGVRTKVAVDVIDDNEKSPLEYYETGQSVQERWQGILTDMNNASQKGLQTLFDSSIGRTTVLQPFGGKYQITPSESSIQKLPVQAGFTNTASVLAHGYNPYIASWSPYHGAVFAIVESVSRIVATGAPWEKIRFSFQEYFERMDGKAEKFGKPVAAILGALEAQEKLGLPSIGGKDSMSGTYQDLHVPPSLLAFGVAVTTTDKVISPEFKKAGENIYLIPMLEMQEHVFDYEAFIQNLSTFADIRKKATITAARAIRQGGVAESLATMSFGNQIGAELAGIDEKTLFIPQYGGFIVVTDKELPASTKYLHIGKTTADFVIKYNGEIIAGATLNESYEATMEPVYPTLFEQEQAVDIEVPTVKKPLTITYKGEIPEKPLVYIPVFPGTNCEYDTAKAFAKAGAEPIIVPFKTLNSEWIEKSIAEMVANLNKAQIFMLSGGFSAADEPDGSGKFIINILLNEKVKTAITAFIARGGLILGICNGFQALVKSGLLPYGEFDKLTENSPTLFRNDTNQHVAKVIQTKIVNTNSPWLQKVNIGDIHSIPVSHGEGKFCVQSESLKTLLANGQIITQYVDFDGNASMESFYNPNGSTYAIEGIISENGQILGKMGHSERYEDGLFQNIIGEKDQQLFESAVAYLKKGAYFR